MPLICAKIFYLFLKGLLIKLGIKYNKTIPPLPPPSKKKKKPITQNRVLKSLILGNHRDTIAIELHQHAIFVSYPAKPGGFEGIRDINRRELILLKVTLHEKCWWALLLEERWHLCFPLPLCYVAPPGCAADTHKDRLLLKDLGLQGSQKPHGARQDRETKIPASSHWLCDEQTLG